LHAFSQKQYGKFYPIASETNEHCKEKARAYTHHIQESMQVCKFLIGSTLQHELKQKASKSWIVGNTLQGISTN
jgi:hypothetical protein